MRRSAAKSFLLRPDGFLLSMLLLFLVMPPARASEGSRDVKREIELLERQWRTAQLAGDISTMDRMLSDDYVGVSMTGQVNTKMQQLARLRNRIFVLNRMDVKDMKVKVVGEVAFVTVKARVEATNESRKVGGIVQYTRIYHHLPSGTWKITNFEATRLPHQRRASDEKKIGAVDRQG